jgi:hypothetical protein
MRRAERAGADAVLTKPCLPDTLLSEIRRVIARSRALREQTPALKKRVMLNRSHQRGDTTDPATPPPSIVCPTCDMTLKYVRSHIGGVSARHQERWDYFECTAGCGMFQYRERTRKLRKL